MRLRKRMANSEPAYKKYIQDEFITGGEIDWKKIIDKLLFELAEIGGGIRGEADEDDLEDLEYDTDKTVMNGQVWAVANLKKVLKTNIGWEQFDFGAALNDKARGEYQPLILDFCQEQAYDVANFVKEDLSISANERKLTVVYEYLGY